MKIGSDYAPSKLRRRDWERYWTAIGFSKKQALKQTLQFAEKVKALSNLATNPTEESIGHIITERANALHTTLG